jgi:hypothetical protein
VATAPKNLRGLSGETCLRARKREWACGAEKEESTEAGAGRERDPPSDLRFGGSRGASSLVMGAKRWGGVTALGPRRARSRNDGGCFREEDDGLFVESA